MKTYGTVDSFRLLNIQVILDDNQVLYEGMVENVPSEVGQLKYSKVEMSSPIKLYVYSDNEE